MDMVAHSRQFFNLPPTPTPPQASSTPAFDAFIHGQALMAATAELRTRIQEIDGDEIAYGIAADITRLVISRYAAAYAALELLHATREGRR